MPCSSQSILRSIHDVEDGSSKGILRWKDQVWKYKALISMKDLHSDGNKRTMVENSVHDIAELWKLRSSRHRFAISSAMHDTSIFYFHLLFNMMFSLNPMLTTNLTDVTYMYITSNTTSSNLRNQMLRDVTEIKNTFDVTTQYAQIPMSTTIYKHHKLYFTAINVFRSTEPIQ